MRCWLSSRSQKRKSRSDQGSEAALHDSAAEGVAGLLVSGGGLSHDGAAERVTGLLGRGGLGGRHFESWG